MPLKHALWRIASTPSALSEGVLPSEALLENMIVAEPAILSREWMIVGRQEVTGSGGRIDLLALAPDGSLILIELKRDKTPRDVVAQALDYACWASTLKAQDLERIYSRFTNQNLATAFEARFNTPFDEETVNQSHQIVIVASRLDSASERIVNYLNQRDIPINVLFFQVFDTDHGQLLSRSWLLDPVETQTAAAVNAKPALKEPWNGEYYACFGHDGSRNWDEARKYGFISAGGGGWYSGTLNLLKAGDLVWVRVPKVGYVGVGRVKGSALPADEFILRDEQGTERPALEILKESSYHSHLLDDPDGREVFVPIHWLETRPLQEAVNETGLFGNQNTVCAPKTPAWRHTTDRLKSFFPQWNANS
ncbi:hypothetical protein ACI01nite_17570 [Acetobacter cibinongensis]|uniref:Nuclease n=1 Tax=Acetobacter cibinongensis TaxID=146475 RepID=A0A0D6N0U5_9PROT|nr:endonuclease NucS domain-containing protein [Acetobacter cibinongensis]GAN59632.1 hypothetical protein Abci_007_035 [Acetobacter cibinongensis]GBQ15369.1 hypothetical protein AA0482_1213 [Acetobacter cibinongensis NRIC 0482]GEL59155.1 hypothetical protein ACI01nite_17570 [Acetobacter cibinongensis]